MKNLTRHRRWIALPVASVLIAIGWLLLRPVSEPDPDTARAAFPESPSEPASATNVSRPSSSAPGAEKTPQLAQSEQARPTPSKRIHPAMQSALDDHPELAQYHWFTQKALPTQEQRKTLQDMLSDQDLIRTAKTNLLASNETVYTPEEEAKRMLDVEFLADAFAWADNPESVLVTEAVAEVLLADNIAQDAPDDLAQSLAGDKMDLYTQLLQRAPERAAEIAQRARGTDAEPLLAYSKDWYDREVAAMRADEMP